MRILVAEYEERLADKIKNPRHSSWYWICHHNKKIFDRPNGMSCKSVFVPQHGSL